MSEAVAAVGSCDVVIIGEYYCDLIFHSLKETPALGAEVLAGAFDTVPGGSFTPALSFARLGVKAHWACGLGTDLYSALIRDEAKKAGISDVLFQNLDRPLRRVTSVFSMQADRGFLTFVDGPDPVVDADRVLDCRPRILLLQGLSALLANLALVRRARSAGILVISDCGHVEDSLDNQEICAALAAIDIFMPNATEASQLTGETEPEKMLSRLGREVSQLVVKAGADGAYGLEGGRIHHVPAKQVDVVDPTGAGDSFNAGFVYGLLKGQSYQDAMALGGLNGSISTTDLGGRAVPDEAQLLTEWEIFSQQTG